MRRIALIAAALAVLSGCGGEGKTKAPKPERAATSDWRTLGDAACGRATNAVAARGWGTTLKDLKRNLPGVARDVRAGIDEISRLPGRPDQQFVADMEALAPRFDQLARASRTMKVNPLDRAITRLEAKVRVAGRSARRAGLEQCLRSNVRSLIINGLRAPVASEQLALIFKATKPRLDAAEAAVKADATYLQGVRDYVAVLADREAAVRSMHVPRWVRPEWTQYLAALHAYRIGIDRVGDRYAAGGGTPHAQFVADVKRPERRMNRKIDHLWDGMGANPTSEFP